jgi:Family of unknown function (DUF6069)
MTKLSFKQSIIAGLYAGGSAAIINAILFFIFHAAGIISDNIFPKPNEPMTVVPVIMASIIPAIIASIVFFLMEKFSNKGFAIFRIVTIVLVVLSLYSTFTVIPGITTGYSLALCVMHLVAAAALIYFIGRNVKNLKTIKT